MEGLVPPEVVEAAEGSTTEDESYEEQLITSAMNLPGDRGDPDRTEALTKVYDNLEPKEKKEGESLLDWIGRIEDEVATRREATE